MKINEHLPGHPVTAGQATRKASESGLDFQQLLQSELLKGGASDQVQAGAPVQSVSPVSASIRLEGLAITERTLDTLQSFARGLENTRLAAEALDPLVAFLEEETVALLSLRNQLPATDPLVSVFDRVATIAYLETAKFRRGDYHA